MLQCRLNQARSFSHIQTSWRQVMSAWSDVSRCPLHAPAAPPQFMLKLRYAEARVCFFFPLRYVAQSTFSGRLDKSTENCGCRCTCVVSMAGGAIQSVTEDSGTFHCTEPRLLDRILSKRGSYSLTSPYSSRWRGSLGLIPDLRKRGSWGAQEVQVGSPCEHVGLTGNGSHRPQKSRVAFSSRGLSFVLSWLQKHARVHLVRTCKCIHIHIHRVSIHIHEAYRVNRCI